MFFKKKKRKSLHANSVNINDMNFQVLEAYKMARTNIVYSIVKNGCKKIVITSSKAAEGKTTTTSNLAISLAQQIDVRVLLIDCDLRKPRIHRFFNIKQEPGLTNCLYENVPVEDVIVSANIGNLDIIPAGIIPPNPSELLASTEMTDLVKKLSKSYDYIIFDTPPVNVVVDAVPLIRNSDGVVIVVREKKSVYPELIKTVDAINKVETPILGVIINGVDEQEKKYGSYGYYRSYKEYKD